MKLNTRQLEIIQHALGKTLNSPYSSAEICWRNGWEPGQRISSKDGDYLRTIEITAIGRNEILAVPVRDGGIEAIWKLSDAEWIEA